MFYILCFVFRFLFLCMVYLLPFCVLKTLEIVTGASWDVDIKSDSIESMERKYLLLVMLVVSEELGIDRVNGLIFRRENLNSTPRVTIWCENYDEQSNSLFLNKFNELINNKYKQHTNGIKLLSQKAQIQSSKGLTSARNNNKQNGKARDGSFVYNLSDIRSHANDPQCHPIGASVDWSFLDKQRVKRTNYLFACFFFLVLF